jgi:DNA invertase Pin-like site-specific DNA recombinase
MLIGYARVSTHNQNLEMQHDALRGVGCENIFEETFTGSTTERPQLRAALEFIRPGDTLVIWKLDRLARSLKQLIETVEDLGSRKIGFRSITESIDTTTPGGKLVFHMFGALAEFERGIIQERTMAGLQAARSRGRTGGRPSIMTPERMAAAQALIKDGKLTIVEVAKQLGISDGTLYKYMPSPRRSATCS